MQIQSLQRINFSFTKGGESSDSEKESSVMMVVDDANDDSFASGTSDPSISYD